MRNRPWWIVAVISLVASPALASNGGARGLQQLHHVEWHSPGAQESSRITTEASRALMNADYNKAVALADQALAKDVSNPWAYYVKGEALVAAGKDAEGLAAIDESISRFQPRDLWGRSVALYGRARALESMGQCAQAQQAYREYAQLVQKASPKSADEARRVATHCIPPRG